MTGGSLPKIAIGMNTKRLLYFTGAAWLFLAAAGAGFAGTTFDLGVVTTKAGGQIVLPIQLATDESPVGFQCEIRFKGAGVEMKAVTGGTALDGHRVSSKLLSEDQQRVVVFSSADKPLKPGIALNIPFEIDGDAESTSLTISLVDVVIAGADGADPIPEDVSPGLLTIQATDGGVPVTVTSVRIDGSEFVFDVQGAGERTIRVEASSDLETWETLGDFQAQGGELEFTDENAGEAEQRYFRATVVE